MKIIKVENCHSLGVKGGVCGEWGGGWGGFILQTMLVTSI